jgi:Na+-transporting methylmalonyl-CoA/oxaloacetate decarboxylase gamma subunit
VIALTGLLILFIGWMGYLTYKTWLEENNEDGLAETSKLYWIYLPVFFFSLFLIMFVWTMWIANSEVRKSEFLKRRKQDTNSPTKSTNTEETLKRISLINEFSNQSDKEQ